MYSKSQKVQEVPWARRSSTLQGTSEEWSMQRQSGSELKGEVMCCRRVGLWLGKLVPSAASKTNEGTTWGTSQFP